MYLPTLKELKTSREVVEVFGGYNHNLRIRDGEFYDMKNMSSELYPVLAPRGKRGVHVYSWTDEETGALTTTIPKAQALIAKDALCYVDGNKFYINDLPYEVDGLNGSADTRLISMGAYVIALPDKVYINTKNPQDCGRIEAEWNASDYGEKTITFNLCALDGSEYAVKGENISPSAPEDPADLSYWIDTSSTPHALKQWSATSATWVTIATTYIKISTAGIGASFKQYDGISITGLKDNEGLKDVNGNTLNAEDRNALSVLDGKFIVWDVTEDYIVVVGILDKVIEVVTSDLKIERSMPVMDFVVESENRLWGCHYGVAENGEVVNEIYASKLGDFKNWNCFMGVSTDSYAASVGTDGQFTGAISHFGFPVFFKENCMHKVYGNYPSNYQIQTTSCRGVQRGCGKSLAIVNEILYYKSTNGVCAFDGSLPADISKPLGENKYSDAVGGAHDNKYYISVKDEAENYHLFVYDTQKGMWHKEDNVRPIAFCSCRGEMYYIDAETEQIMTMTGGGQLVEDPVEWMVETGDIGTTMPDQKYISRLVIRMSLTNHAKASFSISYDSTGEWVHLFDMEAHTLRSFEVPIRPRRCDHFKVRIEGEGDFKIYSIAKTIEQGSDHTR